MPTQALEAYMRRASTMVRDALSLRETKSYTSPMLHLQGLCNLSSIVIFRQEFTRVTTPVYTARITG